MRRTAILLLLLLALPACGDDDATAAVTPDAPRYTAQSVADFVTGRGPTTEHTRAFCAAVDAAYQGNGLWKCGIWSFDERTGQVFRSTN